MENYAASPIDMCCLVYVVSSMVLLCMLLVSYGVAVCCLVYSCGILCCLLYGVAMHLACLLWCCCVLPGVLCCLLYGVAWCTLLSPLWCCCVLPGVLCCLLYGVAVCCRKTIEYYSLLWKLQNTTEYYRSLIIALVPGLPGGRLDVYHREFKRLHIHHLNRKTPASIFRENWTKTGRVASRV